MWALVTIGMLVITLLFGIQFTDVVTKFILEHWDLALGWLWPILLIVLPFALFKRTRGFSATSILIISYGFGILVWALGTATALWHSWIWLSLALFLGSWGGATIGILSSLFKGDWPRVWLLVQGSILVWSMRGFAGWLITKDDN